MVRVLTGIFFGGQVWGIFSLGGFSRGLVGFWGSGVLGFKGLEGFWGSRILGL